MKKGKRNKIERKTKGEKWKWKGRGIKKGKWEWKRRGKKTKQGTKMKWWKTKKRKREIVSNEDKKITTKKNKR